MKNCELCYLLKMQQQHEQHQQQQQQQENCIKTTAAQLIKSLRFNNNNNSSTPQTLCQHQQAAQQLQQQQQHHHHHQQQQQQRCTSVGSTGSSTCDTLSSLSGSALSPTANNSHGGLKSAHIGNGSCLLPNSATALSTALTSAAASAATMPPIYPLPGTPLARSALLPSTQQAVQQATLPAPPPAANGNVLPATAALGGYGDAAAMAANLAESFTLLHQQAHQHFREILYAAHLLGRGKEMKWKKIIIYFHH